MSKDKVPAYGIYPVSTVRDVAESLGFDSVSDDVCKAVAGDVEFKLSMIIQEAQKFMRHGKRGTMVPSDIDHALQALNVQPILHPPHPLSKPTFLPVYTPSELAASNQRQLYYLKDEEIDLASFLKGAKETPVMAREGKKAGVTWKAHWLAIEGVQPLIAENPVTQIADPTTAQAALQPTKPNRRPSSSIKSTLSARTHLSQELQLLFSRLTSALIPDPALATMHNTPSLQLTLSSSLNNTEAGPSRPPPFPATPVEKHGQLSESEKSRQAALSTLSIDPGLAELLPYLVRWLSDNITQSVSNSTGKGKDGKEEGGKARTTMEIGYLVDGLQSLVDNTSLFVEPYLHQLLPPIMSVLLSVPLGAEDDPFSNRLSTTDLRRKASFLLNKLIKTYAGEYETLLPRITRTLARALYMPATTIMADGKIVSLTGRYEGAVLGLEACGRQAVLLYVLGIGEDEDEGLRMLGGKLRNVEEEKRKSVVKVVLSTLSTIFKTENTTIVPSNQATEPNDDDTNKSNLISRYGDLFGEALNEAKDLGRAVLKHYAV